MAKDLTNEFQNMALAMFLAFRALMHNETPVSCVFVSKSLGKIVSIGYNGTNVASNGTKHAELLSIDSVLDRHIPKELHGDINYIKQYFSDVVCYVTVEPCIMCASALRQIGISEVIFGCGNDRFGGNGTILAINREPSPDEPYPSYGGFFRTEAITLLRNFYIQENESAPVPQVKKNKDIEGKKFPEALDFKKYMTEEEFIRFYGEERKDLWESRLAELTPIMGEGYSIRDFVTIPLLKKSLEGVFDDIGDVELFFKFFYSVDHRGVVQLSDKVITMEDHLIKRRRLR